MNVRFFFSPARSLLPLAVKYLLAIRDADINVRAAMLLGAPLTLPLVESVSGLFLTPIGDDFINVVAAPPHFPIGRQMTAFDFLGPEEMTRHDPMTAAGARADVVYEPKTALAMYHTAGHANVAILGALPAELDEDEYDVLKTYDRVLTDSKADAAEIIRHGLNGRYVPPEPLCIRHALEVLC